MGLPILSEIWDGIRWIIDFFINKAPKPIKILIFLFFLLLLGSMIPVMLHLTGIHCDSKLDVVKTDSLNFFQNIRIMFIDKDELFNSSAFVPKKSSIVSDCVYALCNHSGTYYWALNDLCENETIEYKLQSAGDFIWDYGCVICNKTDIYVKELGLAQTHLTYICDSDAYRIPYDDMGWFQQSFCDDENDCMPPPHYYFDSSTGLYTCLDLDVCGVNTTNATITYAIDDMLKENGAELIYPPSLNDYDYRRAILLKCNQNLNPRLTLYGIPIFDYKIWLILIILSVLVMLLFKLKKT